MHCKITSQCFSKTIVYELEDLTNHGLKTSDKALNIWTLMFSFFEMAVKILFTLCKEDWFADTLQKQVFHDSEWNCNILTFTC